MKYISICSGIEAATVAFHGFGWTPLAFSEIEAFPSAVLAARWPQVQNLGDMTKFAEWPEDILAECDLLVGGPPCQAFSVAGLRKSLDDDRGNITLAYVRLLNHIDEVRKRHGRPPAIAVYENVPGLLSTKDNAFGCLIGALAGCDEAPETETGKWPKAGYVCGEARRVGYRILDAQFFGVAQRRRRIFLVAVPCELVASLGDNACPSEILSLRESVRGNPPSRSKAWEGAARSTTASLTSSGRGVERPGESRGQDDLVVAAVCGTLSDGAHMGGGLTDRTHTAVAYLPSVANPLTHRMHKGMNTTVDEGQTPIVTTGGFFDEATCFKPSHFTRGKDGKPSDVTPPLSADADKGDQDTLVATPAGFPDPAYAISAGAQGKGGVFGSGRDSQDTFVTVPARAVAFTQNQREEVRILDISGACSAEPGSHQQTYIAQPAVAYVKATNPHSKEEAPRYEEAAVSACLNGWDERHDPPKHMVAFAQNQLGEVRCNSEVMGTVNTNQNASGRNTPMVMHECIAFKPGQSEAAGGTFVTEEFAPTMQAQNNGSTAVPAVAFANRTRDGIKVPEIMKDGVVPALTNPGGGGRADAVNVCLPTPLQEVSKRTGKSTDDPRAGIGIGSEGDPMYTLQAGAQHGCHAAMQVRRLTPSECEFLQGFPAGHTDIIFRKKPAADGPRYRALGNSMAVPCMVWLGHRIQQATRGDNT